MKKLGILVGSIFALSLLLSAAGSALADSRCRQVNIRVKNLYKRNGTGVTIKVLAVNYYDNEDAKWRTNDLAAWEIRAGGQTRKHETLEYVGNEWVEKMQVKFKFKEDKGWSKARWSNVTTFPDHRCARERIYDVTVTSTTSKKKK